MYRIVLVITFENRTNLTIGRGVRDHVKIDDVSVSRKHSLLKVKNKKYGAEIWLYDNGSKFGTLA